MLDMIKLRWRKRQTFVSLSATIAWLSFVNNQRNTREALEKTDKDNLCFEFNYFHRGKER